MSRKRYLSTYPRWGLASVLSISGLGANAAAPSIEVQRVAPLAADLALGHEPGLLWGQIAFVVILGLTGLLFTRCLLGKPQGFDGVAIFLLALPVGAAAWAIAGATLLSLRAPLAGPFLTGAYGGLLGGALYLCRELRVRDVLYALAYGAGLALLALVIDKTALFLMTPDSWDFVEIGHGLFAGEILPGDDMTITSRAFFASYLHGSAVPFGFEQFRTFQPLIALHILGIFFYAMWQQLRAPARSAIRAIGLSLAATAFVATTFKFLFHSMWVHTNLSCGLYAFIAVLGFWQFMLTDIRQWLRISAVSLCAFILTRVEAPFFAILLVLPFLALARPAVKDLKPLGLFVLFAIMWNHCLADMATNHGGKLKPHQLGVASVALLVLAGSYVWVHQSRRWLSQYSQVLAVGPLLALAAAYVVLFLLKTEHGMFCLRALVANLFYFEGNAYLGHWGFSWHLLVMLLMLCPLTKTFSHGALFWQSSLAFVLLTLVTGFLRFPYSVGFWDSANRMMLHIFPILTFYLFARFFTVAEAPAAPTVAEAKPTQEAQLP